MSTTATPSSFSSGSSTASAVAMAFDVTPSIFMPSRLSAISSRCIGVRRQRMKLNVDESFLPNDPTGFLTSWLSSTT